MQIPDFTRHALRYVATDTVEAGGRLFELRIVVSTTERYWPQYQVADETDTRHCGPKQLAKIGPPKRALWQALYAAMRDAKWIVDPMRGAFEPPPSHIGQALAARYDGGWS